MFESIDGETIDDEKVLRETLIVVINVPRSVQRRERAAELVKTLKMDAVFFDAVDAQDITIHSVGGKDFADGKIQIAAYKGNYFLVDSTRRFDYVYRGFLPRGMVACALSHMMIYSYMQLENKYRNFLVLEDDFTLRLPVATLRKYFAHVPSDFDVIHLNSESKWYPLQHTHPINDHYTHIQRRHFNASVSYMVSKRGAAKLLAYSRGAVSRPPDDLLSNLYTLGGYMVIASREFLFGNDYTLESDCERFSKAEDS